MPMAALAQRPAAAPAAARPAPALPTLGRGNPMPSRADRNGTSTARTGMTALQTTVHALGREGTGIGAVLGLLDFGGDMLIDEAGGQKAALGKSALDASLGVAGGSAESWLGDAAGGALGKRWGVDLLAAPSKTSLLGNVAKGGINMGIGAAVGGITDGLVSTWENVGKYQRGETDGAGAAADILVVAGGGAVGGLASGFGSTAGAALGSMVCPVIGTAVGGIIGGAIGGLASDLFFDKSTVDERASNRLAERFRGPPSRPTPNGPPRRSAPRSANRPAW
jgi:hypothetical protein